MKVIIIGNGIAGQTAADLIRKQESETEISIFTKENFPYYSRIFLPHYIADQITLEKLVIRNEKWYKKRNIKIHLGTEIAKINRQEKYILITGQNKRYFYDKLIIASGSNARKFPYNNPDIKGMFTLRNIADADEIKAYIPENNVKDVFIIGGGLLGIELGYHLRELKINVAICDINQYLLSRQLDAETSDLLRKYLESKGIKIICGEKIAQILGKDKVTGVISESGMKIKTDLILQQVGVIPEITIAKEAEILTDRGIKVNGFMQTNDSDIYAIGDCVQFEGKIWGIIPACMDQASIAANHILGRNPEPYKGTQWSVRLKIAGIKLSCFGPPPSCDSNEEQLIEIVDKDSFKCRKVVIKDNKLKSAVLMGPGKDKYFMKNLGKDVDIKEIQEKLREE